MGKPETIRSEGHFEFFNMDLQGNLAEDSIPIKTTTGLILNCNRACDMKQIRRLAEIARETPDYPVDISAWVGEEGDRVLVWNARIYWRIS